MNRSPRKHLPGVVKNSNKSNSGPGLTIGSPSGPNHVSNPLVAKDDSVDFSAPGQDVSVLDCSDWYLTAGYVAVLGEVGNNVEQPNVGGLHIPSPMSPSTPAGVDGAITPRQAGGNAGMSVNPTERVGIMFDIRVLGAEDVLLTDRMASFKSSVLPQKGFRLTHVSGSSITYSGPNNITWRTVVVDDYMFDQLGELRDTILDGGAKELAVLRFPCGIAWAEHDEALAFWQQLLPVKVVRVLFTSMNMRDVYVQLTSGHILNACLFWDGEDVKDVSLDHRIVMKIIESQQVAR
jgi:hypothetical protein